MTTRTTEAAARRADTLERGATDLQVALLREIKREVGIKRLDDRDITKDVAKVLQWKHDDFGYNEKDAKRVARELVDAFREPTEKVAGRGKKGVGSLDTLVKKALLMRDDITEDLAARIMGTLHAKDITEQLKRNILIGRDAVKQKLLDRLFPAEKGGFSSLEDVLKEFQALQSPEGLAYTPTALKFTPVASKLLDDGLRNERGNKQGPWHRLAREIAELKQMPEGRGTMREGGVGKTVYFEYEGAGYPEFHTGASHRTTLRAFYIRLPEGTIVITNIYKPNYESR
jgi:hypothetical protein